MMEKYIISKSKKNHLLKEKKIHFVNVEIDPRLWHITLASYFNFYIVNNFFLPNPSI
jgi:hypothetical protein